MHIESKNRYIHPVVCFLALVVISVSSCASGPGTGNRPSQLAKDGEQLVISFTTSDGREARVDIGKDESYIVFRLGNASKAAIEFPVLDESSWDLFSYEWYLRGGGPANEGLDLNSLFFEIGNLRYEVYENFSAGDDDDDAEEEFGINVTDLKTNKVTTIAGVAGSLHGSMIMLRDSEKIHRVDP